MTFICPPTRELIHITSEAQWLDLRRDDITSTMVSALFGLSPYVTRFELYHQKANGIELPFQSNERVEAGSRMEQYAAQEVAHKTGWTVEPFKDYVRIPGARMGSSFDCIATKSDGSRGILEIKAVDHFRFKDTWIDGQAPEHIEIQAQFQLEVADAFEWSAIAAFTSIYDSHIFERPRDREMGAGLRGAVAAFLAQVDARQEPEPDFARDDRVIAALFGDKGLAPVDMTADEDFAALLARYAVAKASAKEFDDMADAAKAEIHFRLADAPAAYTDRYRVTAGWTKDTPARVAEPGEIIKGRAGYRQCLVKDLTATKGKTK